MPADKPYLRIVSHLEDCLARHGDTHRGVDWPKAEDVPIRHEVMLGVVRDWPADRDLRVLDFGCGTSAFYEYLVECKIPLNYVGLDISERFIEVSRRKFPENEYHCVDVLDGPHGLSEFDYIVMNGVFTERCGIPPEEMLSYFKRVLCAVFPLARIGLAFNVMSSHVDWERDDLFHLPHDLLAEYLTSELSRHYVIRADYGLYEYTVYVYRTPAVSETF
jgi:SAM-dependent methyltransferase